MKRPILFTFALAATFFVWLAIRHIHRTAVDLTGLESQPSPAVSFDVAVQAVAQMQRADGSDVSAACRTRFWSHGRRTGRVIVLLHGLTNCPQQYSQFAPLFFNEGDNVFVPRMPRNGLTDVNTPELSRLTAVEMRRHADQVVDIAAGLGERMVVVGFSAGGVISSWIAQNRPEPDLVVTVSPALGITTFPPSVSHFLTRLVLRAPNFSVPVKSLTDPPFHAYNSYASRALGEMLRLSEAVFQQAERHPPRSKKLLMVINPNDQAVNEPRIRQLVALWSGTAPGCVNVREFRSELNLTHDLIDPTQKNQRVNIVYPALLHWINTVL